MVNLTMSPHCVIRPQVNAERMRVLADVSALREVLDRGAAVASSPSVDDAVDLHAAESITAGEFEHCSARHD